MPHRHHARNRHAFSLVELLVVIAVIALLAGILVPVTLSVRNMALRTSCQSNLRQIGMVAGTYADDHRGMYPAEGNKGDDDPESSPAWFYQLPPYLAEDDVHGITIFQCPAFAWEGPQYFDHATPKSIKMNGYLDNGGRQHHYIRGRARDEEDIIFFIDGVAGETGMGQWGHAPASAVDHERHRGWVNVLFLDGHTTAAQSWEPAQDWNAAVRWVSEDW